MKRQNVFFHFLTFGEKLNRSRFKDKFDYLLYKHHLCPPKPPPNQIINLPFQTKKKQPK